MKSKQLVGYLFSALMLTCFQQATAQTSYNNGCPPPPPKKPSCCPPHQAVRIDPTVDPKCYNQGVVDVWADFLWWSSNINQITGFEVDTTTVGVETDVKVRFKRPGAHWDPGVRVGLGWNTGYDNWDVQGYWTYFYNSSRKGNNPLSVETDEVESLFNTGHAKNRLRYNAADVELGKAYYVSRHLFIRPFTGIHAIWTSLHSSASLNSPGTVIVNLPFVTTGLLSPGTPVNETSVGAAEAKINLDIDTWGVGPRIGVNTNWGSFQGFSLMANVSTSMLFGKLLGKAKIDIDSGNDIDVRVRDHEYWQVMPTLQMFLGASYAFCFGCGGNQMRMSAGWESNFIWESANFFFDDKPISMQGLTVDIRFDF